MDLVLGKVWPYDPKGILSNRKRNIRSTTCVHDTRPFIEWRANLDTWPLASQMEAKSSVAEGRGDTASEGIGRKGKTDEADFSEDLEVLDTWEGSHPSKNHRSDDVEIIWDEPPQEELIRYGEPDKSKVGFRVNYDGASSSEPSRISQDFSVNRAEVREEIRNRNRIVREKI